MGAGAVVAMSVEATELVLFVDSDEPSYRQKMSISRALARRMDRGTYKGALAPRAFAALLNLAAKKYIQQHRSPDNKWSQVFSPIDRRAAALILVDHFEDWYATDYQSLKRPPTAGGTT